MPLLQRHTQRGPRSRQSHDPQQGSTGRLPDEALQNKKALGRFVLQNTSTELEYDKYLFERKTKQKPGATKKKETTHANTQFASISAFCSLEYLDATSIRPTNLGGGVLRAEGAGLESNVVQRKSF